MAAVADRLATLEELAADPQAPIRRTRSTVRDAQLYFQQKGAVARAEDGAILDTLAGRIDEAARTLNAPHPDYWRFFQDLARIRDETAAVVRRLAGR
jgi:hypothetical protein